MSIHSEWVHYGSNQRGYLAWPDRAKLPLPSVIVIQEVWGVEGQIEAVTERIAASGYLAFAPDLFSAFGPRPESLSVERLTEIFAFRNTGGNIFWSSPAEQERVLASLPEPKRARIAETAGAIKAVVQRLPALIEPLKEAVAYLRNTRLESRDQKLACVGFCMGGALSALLSCEEPDVAAAAVFYGRSPAEDTVAKGVAPVIGFYAESDPAINAGIASFATAMAKAGRSFESKQYPDTKHGFFNEDDVAYDAAATRDSWAKLLQFFQSHLEP